VNPTVRGDWALERSRLGDAVTLPESQAQEMREGFWRMLQRIHLGIPGFIGSGRIDMPGMGGAQFVGGLAGVRTAWTVHPSPTMGMIDAVPVAGLYLFGQYWPTVFKAMGLKDDSTKIIRQLQDEFGLAQEAELIPGTIPIPIERKFPQPFEEEGYGLGAKRRGMRWRLGPGMEEAYAKGMRLYIYRMFLRIVKGIPGFAGSGEIQDGQFVGGMAGTRTAWILQKNYTSVQDAQPIVGFYLYGILWTKLFGAAGLRGNPNDYFDKLKREFGSISEAELRRGTVQAPKAEKEPALKGAELGAVEGAPVRFRSWSRCGNTMFWGREEDIPDAYMVFFINPVDLVFVGATGEVPEGPVLVVRRGLSEELAYLVDALPQPLADIVNSWFSIATRGIPRRELLDSFARMDAAYRNALLSGLQELFAVAPTEARKRIVVAEGSPAHEFLPDMEAEAQPTEPSIVTPDLQAGLDEALADFGVLEC